MLVLDAVTKQFGKSVAVADVSITVPPGQFVGVIGRSGAGKSTTLRMINRLTDADRGRILRRTPTSPRCAAGRCAIGGAAAP